MSYTVYKLTSPSNKVYIGITGQPIKSRWANGKGYKCCPAIFKAINKYGWDNIQKEILYEGLTEEHAKFIEVFLIGSYKSNDKRYGYNLTEGGEGTSGRIVSEETRRIISEKNKGKKLTEEQKEHLRQINLGKRQSEETKRKRSESMKGKKHPHKRVLSEKERKRLSDNFKGTNNPLARKVICLETLKVYDTATQAQKETGATKITACCKHYYKHKSSAGLHWEYYDESISDQEYKSILQRLIKEEYENKHHPPSEENRKKISERSSIPVICVEIGTIFNSMEDACRKYNISKANLCNCCKGKRRTAGGFHWEYA